VKEIEWLLDSKNMEKYAPAYVDLGLPLLSLLCIFVRKSKKERSK